jgi:hypothetical protein
MASSEKEMMARMLGLLSTLHVYGGSCPAGPVYLAFDMDMKVYTETTQMMVRAGLIHVTPISITLTERGKEAAALVEGAYQRIEARELIQAQAEARTGISSIN